jgi:deoxycytidylate deaminase
VTCAKRTVYCAIYDVFGNAVGASNRCDNPQEVCPRLPGEGYAKCESICMQNGHAEMQALRAAKKHGMDVRNGRAYVVGHDYACAHCCMMLKAAGVASVTILFNVDAATLAAKTAPDSTLSV